MPLSKLQLLSLEISRDCDLAAAHKYCPVNRPERHTPKGRGGLTDDEMVAFCLEAKARGFGGLVAWHFYCEPLLELERIRALGRRLAAEAGLGMALWTNGSRLEAGADWVGEFSRVFITDHGFGDRALFYRLAAADPERVRVVPGGHDARGDVYLGKRFGRARPCYRPRVTELCVDYFGDLHLCCVDWAGHCYIGDAREPAAALEAWIHAADLAAEGNLEICRSCQALRRAPVVPRAEYRL